MILVQTPLDSKPYMIGNYVLKSKIEVNPFFIEHISYMKIIVKPSLSLFALHWSYLIAKNSVVLSFYKDCHTMFTNETFFYILTNMLTNDTVKVMINHENFLYNNFLGNKLDQVLFVIENLSENTTYRLSVRFFSFKDFETSKNFFK